MSKVRCFDLTSSGLTTATTAYASGDVLGAEMTLDFGVRSGTSGAVYGHFTGVIVTDDSNVIGALDLFMFTAASTPAADNAANAWADANMQTLTAYMALSTVGTSANNKTVTSGLTDMKVPFYAPTGRLYVVAVTRSANAVFAGGATSLRYRLFAEVC